MPHASPPPVLEAKPLPDLPGHPVTCTALEEWAPVISSARGLELWWLPLILWCVYVFKFMRFVTWVTIVSVSLFWNCVCQPSCSVFPARAEIFLPAWAGLFLPVIVMFNLPGLDQFLAEWCVNISASLSITSLSQKHVLCRSIVTFKQKIRVPLI